MLLYSSIVQMLAHHHVLCCCSLAKPDSRTEYNSLVLGDHYYGIVFVAKNVMAGISARSSVSSLRYSSSYLDSRLLVGLTTSVALFLKS